MKFRSKKSEQRHAGSVEYKKQQSYHYSAKRSQADRVYGRKEIDEDGQPVQTFKRRLRSLPTLLATLLLIIGVVYVGMLSASVNVVSASGGEFIGDKQAVEQKANEFMRSSFLHRVKPIFNEAKLEAELTTAFPQYSDIRVKTYPFRSTAVVEVSFSTPTILLSTGSKLYLLAEDGTVLLDATNGAAGVDTTNLPLVQDQTGVAISVGKPALTTEQVAYISQVAFQAEKNGLKVSSMILVPGGGELHVRFGGLSYYVKFNLFEDARKSSGTFLVTKRELDERGEIPAEYIDVRIPERAYIK